MLRKFVSRKDAEPAKGYDRKAKKSLLIFLAPRTCFFAFIAALRDILIFLHNIS